MTSPSSRTPEPPLPTPQPVDGDVYVTPRYLAGSSGHGDAGFAPVSHWPHHHLDDGPHQLVVTSPDHRIRIGWAGDDYDLWTISAAPDAMSSPQWMAIANQNTPAELVGALTTALAHDWAEDSDRFLRAAGLRSDAVAPLITAGWTLSGPARGRLHVTAPDGQAGASIDIVNRHPDEAITLWAGPAGWGTRAGITFSSQTPPHLIAATTKAFTHPAPLPRWRDTLNPRLAAHATLTPVEPPQAPAPTPRDIRSRIAVRPPVPTGSVPRWSTTTPSALLPARPAIRR
ncbi:DUF317 domain-containing protein [Streptomyces sp. NRRL F-5193]|uniref:DUF317 domain-containing protein n=1 Tax=Streptomyces sp. NRRL F-5193 TaxID=1463860 RepID=UPI002D21989E|nr:DUF317 domain-containing protein [Streptomyces sp. NRRL F-5193]